VLNGLELIPGEATLEFSIRNEAGAPTSYYRLRLPVPAGREDEAREIVSQLGF
jgi:hypothetical protein